MNRASSGPRVAAVALAFVVPTVALVAVLLTHPHWTNTVARHPAGANTILIHNFMFVPTPARVRPGARITVTNTDSTTHTLSSQTPGLFSTGNLTGGTHTSIVAPTRPGRYAIYCKIHNYMNGTLEVTG